MGYYGWDNKDIKDMRYQLQKKMEEKYTPMNQSSSDSDVNEFIDSEHTDNESVS